MRTRQLLQKAPLCYDENGSKGGPKWGGGGGKIPLGKRSILSRVGRSGTTQCRSSERKSICHSSRWKKIMSFFSCRSEEDTAGKRAEKAASFLPSLRAITWGLLEIRTTSKATKTSINFSRRKFMYLTRNYFFLLSFILAVSRAQQLRVMGAEDQPWVNEPYLPLSYSHTA